MAVREEAIDRILILVEDFEYCLHLCNDQQLHVCWTQIGQSQSTARVSKSCLSIYESAQARSVDISHLAKIQYQTGSSRGCGLVDFILQRQILLAECEAPSQIENLDPVLLARCNIEGHSTS